ncbi:hypothetical protein [Bradyrhizobium sp. 5.13L]
MADSDGFTDLGDASALGLKIVEMCDRVLAMHQFVPRTAAKWRFEIDGVRYDVMVTVAPDEAGK